MRVTLQSAQILEAFGFVMHLGSGRRAYHTTLPKYIVRMCIPWPANAHVWCVSYSVHIMHETAHYSSWDVTESVANSCDFSKRLDCRIYRSSTYLSSSHLRPHRTRMVASLSGVECNPPLHPARRSYLLSMSFYHLILWYPLSLLGIFNHGFLFFSANSNASCHLCQFLAPYIVIMRHCLIYLVLLFPFAWTDELANLGFDFDPSAGTYYLDDGLFTSTETTGWSGRDDDWNPDPELNPGLNSGLNPSLLVDASSNKECRSDADQLQMTTGRRLRRLDSCPNNLFQTSPSSQDAVNRKFLESLPIFTLHTYKEPDPNICPEELFKRFIYPICGSSEEELLPDGINISPCHPCTQLFMQLRE